VRRCAIIVLLLLAAASISLAAEIVVKDALILGPLGRGSRSLVASDPIELARVAGTLRPPREGNSVELLPEKRLVWTKASCDQEGWFSSDALVGGYAFATVDSDEDRVMILDAAGHSLVFVNGEPRAGDPYEYGFVRLTRIILGRHPCRLGHSRLRSGGCQSSRGYFQFAANSK
jgi:hypothetical protein